MKTFIQFKDEVAFAYVNSNRFVENSIEVDGNGNDYMNKKFINGNWENAPLIKYAILDKDNKIIQIEETYFSSIVGNNPIINDENVSLFWIWDGTNFIQPSVSESASLEPVLLEEE